MTREHWRLGLLVIALGASACGDSASDSADAAAAANDAGADEPPTADCPVIVSDAKCDKSRRPFVFVHGTYGSGDNFAHVAALLGSNGYCQDRIVGVEYNSLGDQPGTDGSIDKAIDKVLADNPKFTQVDLAGHSQGTSHCGTYLMKATQAAKVAHYINFSGVPTVGDVDTLSLSSMHDLGNTPHHALGNKVKEVTFTDEDHFAVAASTNSFIELYKYLNDGKAPKYTSVQCGDSKITVEGISETFADNAPVAGKVEVREVTDARAAGKPLSTVMSDADGHFGPFELDRNVAYEFKGFDADGTVVGYQYFTPFKRSNRLLRMLSPSKQTFIAALSTDHVLRGPNHVGIVARWAGGAFRQDLGASLTIDGEEVLSSVNAGEEALKVQALNGGVVGLFMFDDNENSKSDLGLVYSSSFLSFTDVFVGTKTPALVELSFTGGSEDKASKDVKLMISNWPSSEGLVSVTFQ